MGVRASLYNGTFREEKGNYLPKVPRHLPDGWTLDVVFRYKYKGLDDQDMAKLGKFYLYDHFKDLTEQEVVDAEKLVAKPFALIRLMAKTAFLRYPNLKNLPDDKYLANCALAWSKLFKENKIDVYLTGLMDETPAIVGLEVARKMGLPIVMMHPSRFSAAFFMCDGDYLPIFWKDLSGKEVEEQYEQTRQEIMGEKIINMSITKVASDTFDILNPAVLFRLATALPRNFYYYHMRLPPQDRKLWYSTEELIVKQLKYFIRSRFARIYMNKQPVEGERFVFFPLHFTDDANLTAKFAIDGQFELIEKMSKIMPHGVYVYVKPHPHWKGCDMPLGTMRRLAGIPNVKLLHWSADTKKLVRSAWFTVIINSNVGFECLLAGKPVVAFGPDFPTDIIPRVTHVSEIFDAATKKIDPAAVKRFIANTRAHSFRIDPSVFATADIPDESDIDAVFKHYEAAYLALKKGRVK